MDIVHGGESAQQLARRSIEGARLDAVAQYSRPGLNAGNYLVAGSRPVPWFTAARYRVGRVEVVDNFVIRHGR